MRRGQRYAANTDVTVEASKSEIERTLRRYGADAFGYVTEGNRAMIQFKAEKRYIRFVLPLPNRNAAEFNFRAKNQYDLYGEKYTPAQAEERYEQACRQAWRALLLIVKAKLEAVETQIVSFEDEFLPYTVLPSGETVAEWMQPQVDEAYKTGLMPPNLMALAPGKPQAKPMNDSAGSTESFDAQYTEQ